MEFTPITTQEELDKIISARLTREREATAKKYGDYEDLKSRAESAETKVGELTRQLEEADARQADHDKVVGELTAKVKGYETASVKTRIALEVGLPYEMIGRLTGETEEDIRADAQVLARYVGKPASVPPLPSREEPGEDQTKAALKDMLHRMKGDS